LPGEAVVATAKLALTVPAPEIVQAIPGLLAKNAELLDEESVQVLEVPVGKPPPDMVIGVPSRVPYPGDVAFGLTEMVGDAIFWYNAKAVVTLLPPT
jgi:hypothetical protein